MNIHTEIKRERRVGMAPEGQRYMNVLLWKQGKLLAQDVKDLKKSLVPSRCQSIVSNLPTEANGCMIIQSGRKVDPVKNYLWPVPLTQLEHNPNLG